MTRSQLTFDDLCQCLAAQLGREVAAVQGPLRLVEDLDIDSLAMHAVLIEIEEAGGHVPPPEVLEKVSTVRQLYAAVTGDAVS